MKRGDKRLGRIGILKLHHLAGDAKREPGPCQRGQMALSCCFILLARGIGAKPPPRRMTKRRRQLAIACVLVSGGKRLIDKVAINSVFLQAAANGKCRAPPAPLASRLGKRKRGIIDIAKPDAVIDHRFQCARHIGFLMRLPVVWLPSLSVRRQRRQLATGSVLLALSAILRNGPNIAK